MPVRPIDDVTLSEIERALVLRRGRLSFPPALEERFEADSGAERCRWLLTSNAAGFLFYLMTLSSDAHLLPDVFRLALTIKLGIVLPVFLLALFVFTRQPAPWLREAMVPLLAITTMTTQIYLVQTSASPLAAYAHYGSLIGIVIANLIVRARFWFAVTGSFAAFAIYAGGVSHLEVLPAEARVSAIISLCVAVVCTLYANFKLERDHRRTYLIGLQDRVRAGILSQANQELSRISSLDALTGLANRRGLDERLSTMWTAAQASRQSIAVLMLDIDHFKRFNDRYGHQAGDTCLKEVADVLRTQVRGGIELAARYGGEEFIVALPGADLLDGIRAGERLRRAIEARALRNEPGLSQIVTASIGVAAAPANQDGSPQTIITAADAALYEAKRRGRNRVWPPILTADMVIGRDGGEIADVA